MTQLARRDGRPCREFKSASGGKFPVSKSLLSFLLFIALTFLPACDRGRERANVLTGRGEPEVRVMDFSDRLREEGDAVAEGVERHRRGACRRLRNELLRVTREVKLGPLRARDRPVVLVANDEPLAGMTDVELHPRLLVPSVLLALEKVAEEPLLKVDVVVRIVVRPMLDPVHLEPLLKPSKLPRGCSGCPPQFAADNSGTFSDTVPTLHHLWAGWPDTEDEATG
jgi:hypothetical protein